MEYSQKQLEESNESLQAAVDTKIIEKQRIIETNKKTITRKTQENFRMELKTITDVEKSLLDFEKVMENVTSQISSLRIQKEVQQFISQTATRQSEEVRKKNLELEKMSKEIEAIKKRMAEYDDRLKEGLGLLQNISEVYENHILGYLSRVLNNHFSNMNVKPPPLPIQAM